VDGTREITADDIIVASPDNMQVDLIEAVLPRGARVRTVDRFQGQEALSGSRVRCSGLAQRQCR
jgi:superfamily I DNA and/or RNA helicase